jgi:hypothetical protein
MLLISICSFPIIHPVFPDALEKLLCPCNSSEKKRAAFKGMATKADQADNGKNCFVKSTLIIAG